MDQRKQFGNTQRAAIVVVAFLSLALGGCAGGSSTSASVGGSVTVQGVSTPTSVSVVTATNAD